MVNTFVFMGRPGSGKGVQSKLLSEKLGCQAFSTGARMREMAKIDSALGHKLKGIVDSGDLTPYWFASFVFEEVLFSLKSGEKVVIEGIGRREPESKLFAEVCEWLGRDFLVIYLDVSEKTVTERLNKRRTKEGRVDDNNIQNRFDNYDTNTVPAIEFFRSIGKVVDINGEPIPDVIATDIWEKVSKL
jgi:adenylate kinase